MTTITLGPWSSHLVELNGRKVNKDLTVPGSFTCLGKLKEDYQILIMPLSSPRRIAKIVFFSKTYPTDIKTVVNLKQTYKT